MQINRNSIYKNPLLLAVIFIIAFLEGCSYQGNTDTVFTAATGVGSEAPVCGDTDHDIDRASYAIIPSYLGELVSNPIDSNYKAYVAVTYVNPYHPGLSVEAIAPEQPAYVMSVETTVNVLKNYPNYWGQDEFDLGPDDTLFFLASPIGGGGQSNLVAAFAQHASAQKSLDLGFIPEGQRFPVHFPTRSLAMRYDWQSLNYNENDPDPEDRRRSYNAYGIACCNKPGLPDDYISACEQAILDGFDADGFLGFGQGEAQAVAANLALAATRCMSNHGATSPKEARSLAETNYNSGSDDSYYFINFDDYPQMYDVSLLGTAYDEMRQDLYPYLTPSLTDDDGNEEKIWVAMLPLIDSPELGWNTYFTNGGLCTHSAQIAVVNDVPVATYGCPNNENANFYEVFPDLNLQPGGVYTGSCLTGFDPYAGLEDLGLPTQPNAWDIAPLPANLGRVNHFAVDIQAINQDELAQVRRGLSFESNRLGVFISKNSSAADGLVETFLAKLNLKVGDIISHIRVFGGSEMNLAMAIPEYAQRAIDLAVSALADNKLVIIAGRAGDNNNISIHRYLQPTPGAAKHVDLTVREEDAKDPVVVFEPKPTRPEPTPQPQEPREPAQQTYCCPMASEGGLATVGNCSSPRVGENGSNACFGTTIVAQCSNPEDLSTCTAD